MRKFTPNDWRYLRATCGWSLLACEGLNIAALLVFLLLSETFLGLHALFFLAITTAMCQVMVVSSIVTGLVRRRVLERGSLNDENEAAGTYGINLLIGFGMTLIGSLLFSLYYQDPNIIWTATVTFAMYGLIGSLLLSPVIVPAVMLSQRFMTKTAQRYPRTTHA